MSDTEFRALSRFCYTASGVLLAISLISIAGMLVTLFLPDLDLSLGWVMFGIIALFLTISLQNLASEKLEEFWGKGKRRPCKKEIAIIICSPIIALIVFQIEKRFSGFALLFVIALLPFSALQEITRAFKEIRRRRET
ncbi:MAG: hypothetical protein AB7E30_03085 [Lawsonibacter sp.]